MIVIKIGGGETINIDNIIKDLKNLKEPYVIVHGGNFAMDTLIEKLGVKKIMLASVDGQKSRYTNQKIIDCMFMAYAGYMNKTIVMKCQEAGINAIGLTGLDGKLIIGKKHKPFLAVHDGKKKIIRDDMTGSVEKINVDLLKTLLMKGFVPVITPPIVTVEKQAINVDGDKIALLIATEFKAKTLLFLIEANGFLKNVNDSNSVIKALKKEKIDNQLINAQGRMKKKLLVAKWALADGVKKVCIGDGRIKNPISLVLSLKKGTIIQ